MNIQTLDYFRLFRLLVLVKTKRAFPPLQPNNFIRRKSGIRKQQKFNMLEKLTLRKTEFIFSLRHCERIFDHKLSVSEGGYDMLFVHS